MAGTGSQVDTLPSKSDATKLDLSERNQIIRLDPGDQTCTVEGGVLRSQLDAALAEHDLELPCLGSGTIAGIFASDPFGPAGPGSIGPRNLLLGIDAMLADGTTFKSGAPVVKSVAGFDVHKLFVGSRGRLFLAMQMHLRLKPRPRSEQWFANRLLTMDEAIALLHALRDEAQPPTTLALLGSRAQLRRRWRAARQPGAPPAGDERQASIGSVRTGVGQISVPAAVVSMLEEVPARTAVRAMPARRPRVQSSEVSPSSPQPQPPCRATLTRVP